MPFKSAPSFAKKQGVNAMPWNLPRPRLVSPLALLALAAMLAIAPPLSAKDSLGVFSAWGAFRDPAVPRCYAIAVAKPSSRTREYQPYASVGTWPKRAIRGQFHIRLSRAIAPGSEVVLRVGMSERFTLAGGGGDAWAQDRRMDAAIVAAMRSASGMSVSARDRKGNNFSDSYSLEGVATAMDAATVGCARLN